MGEHHKELLHEVCDLIDDSECDVLHADVDRDAKGIEVCIFYILHKITGAIQSDERQALKVRAQQASKQQEHNSLSQQPSLTSRHTYIQQDKLNALYQMHGVEGYVTVDLGIASPPMSPSGGPSAGGNKAPRAAARCARQRALCSSWDTASVDSLSLSLSRRTHTTISLTHSS